MERRSLYLHAAALTALAVLIIIAAAEYDHSASLDRQLAACREQQEKIARILVAEHAQDTDAARRAWIAANAEDYAALRNQGMTVEADSVRTEEYTVVFDLQDPAATTVEPTSGGASPGEAIVYLGQYYEENMTRVPGWAASYTVNTTTHSVTGPTTLSIENIAYQYYVQNLAPDIYLSLGVTQGSVTGSRARTIDCSRLDSGTWLDVTEYAYSLKNVDVRQYLLVKTYVDASTERVTSVDVSKPYFSSVTGSSY